jgi:hypothetical protein
LSRRLKTSLGTIPCMASFRTILRWLRPAILSLSGSSRLASASL